MIMIVLQVVGVIVVWLSVATLTFVGMDALFGQPMLGKWWRRK